MGKEVRLRLHQLEDLAIAGKGGGEQCPAAAGAGIERGRKIAFDEAAPIAIEAANDRARSRISAGPHQKASPCAASGRLGSTPACTKSSRSSSVTAAWRNAANSAVCPGAAFIALRSADRKST